MSIETEQEPRPEETRDHTAPTGWRAGRALPILLVLSVAAGLFAAGLAVGGAWDSAAAGDEPRREFLFEIADLPTANQGGNVLNLFFHVRYDGGLAEQDLPDYRKLRDDAIGYLEAADLSSDPYWETLNHGLCAQLMSRFPLDAISCQLQVVGEPELGPRGFGYRSSVETLGDIDPLRVPGPSGSS